MAILRKKNKFGGIMLPNVKLYYKSIVIITDWHCHENRHIDQWHRIERPEINPYLYSQYLTEEASTHNGLKIVYSINGVGKIGQICAKIKLDHLLTPHTRINSKWFKDLNVRPETIKILEENIGSKTSGTVHSNIYWIYLLRQGKQKEKKKQMRLHQTKKFLHGKGNHQQNKKTAQRMGDHIHQYN